MSPRALLRLESRRERLLGASVLAVLFYCIVWHLQESSWSTPLSSPPTYYSSFPSCAILLYGSPNGFPVTWPALRRNVILPNAPYGCDYYVHTFDEDDSTGSQTMATDRIVETMQEYFEQQLSRDPLTRHLVQPATVHVSTSTQEEFETAHVDLLHRVDTKKDELGRPIYFPFFLENGEEFNSTTDTLKTWHSIQQVWQDMERHQQPGRPYSRVAILRWDIVYMTPVDIYQIDATRRDVQNKHVVIPGFAKYPVNDRGIYGPAKAVRMWATERFRHVDAYVQEYRFKRPGSGIHSERYMGQFLLPRMQSKFPKVEFVDRSDWCFYRVQPNHAVWISDCSLPAHARRDDAVAYVTGCSCSGIKNGPNGVKEITCCANETAVVQ